MKDFTFPVFKTKVDGATQTFALEDPVERRKYFDLKVGSEIEKLRDYLREGTFVAFLLGPKNSGKGTYSKLFAEALGGNRTAHISVGDIVRDVHKSFENEGEKKELMEYLESRYRGLMPLSDAIDALLGRSTKNLLPTELILALVEREITKAGKKALFIDGFPRSLDQVSYSLYFRTLMGYRDDPDFFVFIDVPETIINERMKGRVICPICHVPRHPLLLKTKEVGYDEATKEFYLKCDNPSCNGARMVAKEGDDLGIEAIRDRIEVDREVMRTLLKLEGVLKIYLRNAVPVSEAKEKIDTYEITPEYRYSYDADKKKTITTEEPWVVPDEEGIPSHSLLPGAVVVSLIRQVAEALKL